MSHLSKIRYFLDPTDQEPWEAITFRCGKCSEKVSSVEITKHTADHGADISEIYPSGKVTI